jgi:hypothetical protein
MKILLALLMICALLVPATAEARGGGGHSSGGHSSSHSSSRSSVRSTPRATVKPKTTVKPKAATVKPKAVVKKPAPVKKAPAKPSKPVPKASTKKPTNKKYTNSKGTVGQNGYSPRFRGGYVAPANSVVYYPSHSALDYLPWIYLFSQQHSPQHDSATVVQPNGREVKVEPVKEGTDGMAVFNWIIMILLAVGTIVGIVYVINKLTTKKGY